MKTGSDASSNNRRVALVFSQRTDELARPDKVQLMEKNALQLPELLSN